MKRSLIALLLMSTVVFSYAQTSFITIWDTNQPSGTYAGAGNTTIQLPVGGGTYAGSWVKTGEPAVTGTFTSATLINNVITVPGAGTYEVTISAAGAGFYWQNGASYAVTDRLKLKEIKQWGNLWAWGNRVSLFRGCANLQVTATDAPLLTGTLNNMFLDCTSLTGNASFNNWDVSAVTDMNTLFYNCENFNADISAWNMQNVKVTANMFYNAKKFNQPLNTWNVSAVTNMNNMFYGAEAFNQPLDNWNVSAVTTMNNMFYNSGFNNSSIGNWTFKSGVSLTNFLNTDNGTGMDCINFSNTLKGWADNPNTPSGLALGAAGRFYGDQTSYGKLQTEKNWTFNNAAYDAACALALLGDVKKITAVAPVQPVSAPVKTIFSLLPLPARVDVTYDGGEQGKATVKWSEVTPYNPYRLGEYQVTGTVIPDSGAINFDNLTVTTSVTLREDIKIVNTFTPNGDGKNDTWIIPDLKCYVHPSVEVYDRDGKRLFYSTDPNIGWDGKNQSGQVQAGSYFYIIKVPDLLMVKKGVLTVIK